ncbi:putative Late nodulin [Medicago truncatula]|uniref:Putative Late nodulin n=1 Tax=Medicago truncatula TaxID=3880 RepID=A0A396JEG9_MEDTR|nr:putative Late nodulin [Medicago truncatula]
MREKMAQIPYMFYTFIIIFSVFFVTTKSDSILCTTHAQCPGDMCELPQFVWCERICDRLSLGAKERGLGADSGEKYED